jgi:hypothetical protein
MKTSTRWFEQTPDLAKRGSSGLLRLTMALSLAAFFALPSAQAIEAINETLTADTNAATRSFRIIETQLNSVSGNRIETAAGAFALSADCRFYRRNAQAIERIDSIAGYRGVDATVKVVDGTAVRVVLETQEPIR